VADSRLWVFVVASLLGFLYLVVIPILHFQSTGGMLSKATAELNDRETKVQQQVQEQQQQLSSIANSGQIDEFLKSDQIAPAQKQLLSQIKANPNLIQQLQQQDQAKLSQMKADKAKAVDSLNREALVSRLRTEIRSALIAIAFIAIGWTGLRNVLKG
jgi:TolA-binding protein